MLEGNGDQQTRETNANQQTGINGKTNATNATAKSPRNGTPINNAKPARRKRRTTNRGNGVVVMLKQNAVMLQARSSARAYAERWGQP